MAMDVMLGIHLALDELIEMLQSEYVRSMARMLYVEVHSTTFPIPLRLGTYKLQGDIYMADLAMTHLARSCSPSEAPG